jgi:hypothetical protein
MFVFKKLKDPNNQYDTADLEMQSHAVTLPEILTDFQDFLKGSGYCFDGEIEIVKEEPFAEFVTENEDPETQPGE